jgi:hypothetical protein
MGLFRRREPLHERLAREGGLVAEPREPEPLDTRPPVLETGIHGMQRPRAWDATVTADAEGIDADEVTFAVLPDSTVLVEDGPDAPLQPLADAVERELRPPYRAHAVRRGETLWAVQARRIEVLSLPDAPPGETLDLTRTPDDGTELRVDGERIFGTVPALEERGAREGRSFAVHAERLDGDLWEVRAAPL